jgi:hypothetical protein
VDESFTVLDGKVVPVKSYTDYTLDPSTGMVLRVELRDVDPSGKVVNRHVCEEPKTS